MIRYEAMQQKMRAVGALFHGVKRERALLALIYLARLCFLKEIILLAHSSQYKR
ncbi:MULTISPECIES: hypothetical protein [Vreelandella]|uniref:hypothetical protein n=1 Tax=Vreelandella TaxID=3137766 RepID=UPI001331A41B|nr:MULTISPECIES: hypothetical protein [Halomonas]